MYPVLTVEGKEVEVYGLYYRDNKVHSVTVLENFVSKDYHDISENVEYYSEKPAQLDLKNALKWVGRYEEINETLDKMITDKDDELIHLAIVNIEEQQPFTPNDVQKAYFYKQREMIGLMEAQEIVQKFMIDDVDLSGGEDNDVE